MVQLGQHFKSVDGRDRSDWKRLQHQFAKKRLDQERKDKLENRLDDNIAALAVEVIMATELQIQQFQIKLTSYDAATVTALMDNQERLDAVNLQMSVLLDQAYVLEDGRRVFKTEDGTQVFDEHGEEVGADVVDPASIGDEHPTWESYQTLRLEKSQIEVERTEILEFQERLDDAREQTADGQISEVDLEALEADLADMMPASVRANVPGMEAPAAAPELSASFAKPAAPAQMQIAGASAPALTPIQ